MTYRFSKTLENTYEGTKNKLLHRYEVKILEAYSKKFAVFFQFI